MSGILDRGNLVFIAGLAQLVFLSLPSSPTPIMVAVHGIPSILGIFLDSPFLSSQAFLHPLPQWM